MVQVYTGNGKGKTTAAVGLALRAAGRGLRVRIFQFLKGGAPVSGEFLGLDSCQLPVVWRRFDDQIPPLFQKGPADDSALRRALERALEEVRAAVGSGDVDLVILDEINVAMAQGWVPVEAVLSLLRDKDPSLEVVLTGRGAPAPILERADLVTEMQEVKHPFSQGVGARKGIEF